MDGLDLDLDVLLVMCLVCAMVALPPMWFVLGDFLITSVNDNFGNLLGVSLSVGRPCTHMYVFKRSHIICMDCFIGLCLVRGRIFVFVLSFVITMFVVFM